MRPERGNLRLAGAASQMRASERYRGEATRETFCGKQIPLCVPRPPNCGGQEKARDSVRDDMWFVGSGER
jgi:hypothetical protein